MRPNCRHDVTLAATTLLLASLPLSSCITSPRFGFQISGRLTSGFGCDVLQTQKENYELHSWPGAKPPAGSQVTLRVRGIGGASTCMVGPIVEVLRVVEVRTDFRTHPVTRDETWAPGDPPIVLGQVDVEPGATLTILPGTVVTIIDHGQLRVRGALVMVGTADAPIRVVGGPSPLGAGSVVIEPGTAPARIQHASLVSLAVHRSNCELRRFRAQHVTVSNCEVQLHDLDASAVSVSGARVVAVDGALGNVDGTQAEMDIIRSRLKQLSLSYSSAKATESVFEGERCYVLFHGASTGLFERNVFRADETIVEVRHTSSPAFHDNDFISETLRVECETYQLDACVRMENNWWGTADEDQIRAKLDACICYAPWRTGPVEAIAALR